MYYGWTGIKVVHEERVNELLKSATDNEGQETVWPSPSLGELLNSVAERLARTKQTPHDGTKGGAERTR